MMIVSEHPLGQRVVSVHRLELGLTLRTFRQPHYQLFGIVSKDLLLATVLPLCAIWSAAVCEDLRDSSDSCGPVAGACTSGDLVGATSARSPDGAAWSSQGVISIRRCRYVIRCA